LDPSAEPATCVAELAVNLDDLNPELLGDVQDRLLAAGALDVWTTPIGMKKNRPAVMLSVLCPQEDRPRMARLILQLTGSFGVRYRQWDRMVLDRLWQAVQTPFGQVRMKIGRLDGQTLVMKPEFEDVRALAEAAGVPSRLVHAAAVAAAQAAEGGCQGAP
jgi:uncharacterized protein (DUF111 family)